jgi:hypothetical protein
LSRARASVLVALWLAGCQQHVDPCDGHTGLCVGVHLDSEARPLDEVRVTLDGVDQFAPPSPAPLPLPVRFAIDLPDGQTRPHFAFAGMQSGQVKSAATADVDLTKRSHAEISVTLRAAAPGGDLGGADLSTGAADLAGADLADLATRDLSAPDFASTDLAVSFPVTVVYRGTGTGVVQVNGANCSPPSCTMSFPPGTVTLNALTSGNNTLRAITGACISSTANCSFTLSAAANVVVDIRDSQLVMLRVLPVLIGSGSGTVSPSPSPSPSACGPNCYAYPAGTLVKLSEATSDHFLGWGGTPAFCKPGTSSCSFTLSGDTGVTASFSDKPMNYAFVTSTPTTLAAPGRTLSAIHAICQTAAQTAGLPNHSAYLAWISTVDITTGVNPAAVLAGKRGWVRVDGLPVGDTVDSITMTGRPLYPLQVDENGNRSGAIVWTGTLASGNAPSDVLQTCNNWTSTASTSAIVGYAANNSDGWTDTGTGILCSGEASLYCFEATSDNPLVLQPTPGTRRAFVTSQAWSPGMGHSDADATCNLAAASAIGGGRFRAFLQDPDDALNFDQTAGPWARLDHTLVFALPSEMTTVSLGAQALATLDQLVNGSYAPSQTKAWTNRFSTDDCNGWRSTSTGDSGDLFDITQLGDNPGGQTCDRSARLVCLEE